MSNRLQATVSPLPAVPIAVLHRSQQPGRGIRLDLTKVDDRGLLAAADRAAAPPGERPPGRLAAVTAPTTSMMWSDGVGTSTATAMAAVHGSPATNLVDLRIGTPSLALTAVLDTGSYLIGTQCDDM